MAQFVFCLTTPPMPVYAGVPGTKPTAVVTKPKPKLVEDIPGVPTAAWARVKRGVPASDPFKPGEGFMLMVDGARFLPGPPHTHNLKQTYRLKAPNQLKLRIFARRRFSHTQ